MAHEQDKVPGVSEAAQTPPAPPPHDPAKRPPAETREEGHSKEGEAIGGDESRSRP